MPPLVATPGLSSERFSAPRPIVATGRSWTSFVEKVCCNWMVVVSIAVSAMRGHFHIRRRRGHRQPQLRRRRLVQRDTETLQRVRLKARGRALDGVSARRQVRDTELALLIRLGRHATPVASLVAVTVA